MRKPVLLLLAFASLPATGQEATGSRFSAGLSLSAGISSADVYADPAATHPLVYTKRKTEPAMAADAGFRAAWKMSRRFTLEAGFSLSHRAYYSADEYHIWSSPGTIGDRYTLIFYNSHERFLSIDIPLNLRWETGKGDFRYYAFAGFAASSTVSRTREISQSNYDYSEFQRIPSNPEKIIPFASAGCGVLITLGKSYFFKAGPFLTRSLLPVEREVFSKTLMNAAGVETGFFLAL